MKRLLVLIILILMGTQFILAQRRVTEDVVYLKNGSVIRGLIVEEVPGVSLKIQTADRNVFVFQLSEIEKIVYEPITPRYGAGKDPETKPGMLHAGTFAFQLEFSHNGSLRQYEAGNFTGLTASAGYRLQPGLVAGIGIGIENQYEMNWIPVFGEIRADLFKSPVQPFVYGRAGYNTPSNSDYYYQQYFGGMFYGLGFGIKAPVAGNTSLLFSVGYRYQYYQYESYIYPEPWPYPVPGTGGVIIGGEANTGGEPGNDYPVSPPEIWPPNYYNPVRVSMHGHFITFTAGISF
jgi:hypothetical protein